MQDFLDFIIKSPKTPLAVSLPGLVGKSLYLALYRPVLYMWPPHTIETKHEAAMDFGEFVEVTNNFIISIDYFIYICVEIDYMHSM